MKLYYNIHNPSDVRDLEDAMIAWIAAGNPKAEAWEELPAQPSPDAIWQNGQWVAPVIDPAVAARKVWPNASAFLFEFTMPELAAIELSTDHTIAALRLLLASWPADIYSDDPRIIGGLSALVAAGIITEARRGEILAK